MKHYVTVIAFSVSSLAGFSSAEASTPIESIRTAQRVEVHFRPDASRDYLARVQAALADRAVRLEYTDVAYDARGRLSRLSYVVQHGLRGRTAHTVDVSEREGGYLFLEFAG